MISTRGRYALRVMIDLAQNGKDKYIPMKEVAERQGISLKYLERILPVLAKNNLIEGVHGKGGGYRLTKTPNEYVIGDILRLTEGNMAPVACLSTNANECKMKDKCHTVKMWQELHGLINDFFDNKTLEDLL